MKEKFNLEVLNGLILINNVVKLELIIELTYAPFNLWLELIKNLRMSILLWRQPVLSSLVKKKQVQTEQEHKLFPIEYMLRRLSNRIKILDYFLYRNSEGKVQGKHNLHYYYNVS
jgi:hypothetical protein